MGYTLVIIKIRFENLTRILHFPNLKFQNISLKEIFCDSYILLHKFFSKSLILKKFELG